MQLKIIKPSKYDVFYIYKCPCCGLKMKGSVQHHNERFNKCELGYYPCIECPNCFAEIDMREGKLKKRKKRSLVNTKTLR